MSKTYILEPVEVTFREAGIENRFYRDDASVIYEALAEGVIIEFSGTKLKYAGVNQLGSKVFTPDGIMPETEPENWASVQNQALGALNIRYKSDGTFTVSIYTESDDDKSYIDPKLSKNIVHNDHPYNDVESFLAKQGDPKTGYNTVEKISNATISGGGDSGSSENAGYSVKKTEDARVTDFSTSEIYSEKGETGFEIPIGFPNVDVAYYPAEFVIEGDYKYKWSDESSNRQRHFKGILNPFNLTYWEDYNGLMGNPGKFIAFNGADDGSDIIIMRPACAEMKALGATVSPISLSNVTVTAVYYDISVTEEFSKAVEFVVNLLQ